MEQNRYTEYGGERALFRLKDTQIEHVQFNEGDSALKEAQNVTIRDARFKGRYVLWHDKAVRVQNAHFEAGSRSSIWYVRDFTMVDCEVRAPKMFRDSQNLIVENTTFETTESFWDVKNVQATNITMTGGMYPFFHAEDVKVEQATLFTDYIFQHVKNLRVKDAHIKSKDAFWNNEDVVVENAVIEGEYVGWYSKNMTFINCTFKGTQPFCYSENIVLQNCVMIDTDGAFEDSTIHASIQGEITSVINPKGGVIEADAIGHFECVHDGVEVRIRGEQ